MCVNGLTGASHAPRAFDFNTILLSKLQRIPYRIVYPKASEREWRLKNKEERTVTALQLSNPDMEMSEIWPHTDTDGNEENKGEFVKYRMHTSHGHLSFGLF